jgi:hypothetical protein
MIHAYPDRASVVPGEQLVLHVSTDQPRFRVHFHRWEGALVALRCSPWLRGEYAPPRAADEDWQWPGYAFEIPPQWHSAVYIALLEDEDANARLTASLNLSHGAALFVVRGHGHSALLYKLPLATYHAYNCSGGGCFYFNPPRSARPPGARVSLQRPGGGIGGATWGAADHYDASSPRQTFAHWDARFIGWLLKRGYAPEFCTGFDLDSDPALCRRYRLLLSVGHDEYWNEAERDQVEGFVEQGGNVAFFGANLCWWRVRLVEHGRAMVCHQGGAHGARDQWWPPHGAGRPEDALGGVSYRHGGGWWDGARDSSGFIVQHAAHWVFEGTGLHNGQIFGAGSCPPLVGYECDGAPLEPVDAAGRQFRLARTASAHGTPGNFCLLAAGVLGAGWQERPPRELFRAAEGIHAACMGVYSRNGTVFTTGTTDWAQVLASEQDRNVEIITRNVLDRLLRRTGAYQ